ncbi:DNA methyltransferase [Paracoccus sp. NGMCC 1.201697]|uniref:site-specific DNA-methyltransferase (adenine-specific) n=1 Tax=Paracoccus broussonetiae subsp. drimophilus TaxID=3373869 RepID=A0ABW7LVW5_9RHOB
MDVVAYARSEHHEDAPPLEMGENASLRALAGMDWDFAGAKTNYLTHRLHPYPAKFIPQIPNALIQELSRVGDTVGDIFCGSGTTLVESLTLKRNAVGVDASPLACLIARAKTTMLTEEGRQELLCVLRRVRQMAENAQASSSSALPGVISAAWRPAFPKLSFWFEDFIIEELAEALQICRAIASPEARTVALASFSSIVVTVSRQDSDTRYVRRDKGTVPGDAFKRFARALEQSLEVVAEFTDIVEPRFNCTIVEKNLLLKPDVPMLDLVVCSPPYPNAFSYHLYHMTRMIWLGMDQPRFKAEEIGSHRKYSKRGPGAATVETFQKEFSSILSWLSGRLKRGKYACFVVGDSTLAGTRVSNADVISEAGLTAGFREAARIDRRMQATKKSFNPAIGKIKTEQILILENVG